MFKTELQHIFSHLFQFTELNITFTKCQFRGLDPRGNEIKITAEEPAL